jgi:hypothetical protein
VSHVTEQEFVRLSCVIHPTGELFALLHQPVAGVHRDDVEIACTGVDISRTAADRGRSG